mgnify:CR=1 FL=1
MAETPAQKAAAAAVAAIRKTFGRASAAMLLSEGGSAAEVTYVVPTGSAVLDRWIFGVGGLPGGRIVSISGQEGSGKTTLATALIAACQRDGGIAMLSDNECAYDPGWAVNVLGVDPDALVLAQAETADEVFESIEVGVEAVRKKVPADKAPILFVWDSVASTPTKREVEEGLTGEAAIGEKARLLSNRFNGRVQRFCMEQNVTLLIVNQLREKIGQMYGDKWTEPGGNAIRFAASVRLRLHPVAKGSVKRGDEHIGRLVGVKTLKNKVAIPYRTCQLKLMFAHGFDEAWAVINHAKDLGVVPNDLVVDEAGVALSLEKLGWKGAKVLLIGGPSGKIGGDDA